MKKVLFISNDASRSGAPIVLLYLLRWLKEHTSIQIETLLLWDGPIVSDFEQIGKTHVLPRMLKERSLLTKARRRLLKKDVAEERTSRAFGRLRNNGYDLVFGNTILSLPMLLKFKEQTSARCVIAIHELSYVLGMFYSREFISRELPKVDRIFAGSKAVSDTLTGRYGIDRGKIEVVHAFIESVRDIQVPREKLMQDLGIKPGELIIGGAGTTDLRKGTDLIIPLAYHLKHKHPEVSFKLVWLGADLKSNFARQLLHDAENAGVADVIRLAEHCPNPTDYINLYDIFILPSREDPFPLVALDAAWLQKTIVAFEKAGGIPELVADGAGFLAPYLDVERMAAIIADLYHHPEQRLAAGKRAKEEVDTKYNCRVIPPRVYELMVNC